MFAFIGTARLVGYLVHKLVDWFQTCRQPAETTKKSTFFSQIRTYAFLSTIMQVKESLGEGGYGAVYHVWDAQLKEDLALKVCPDVLRFRSHSTLSWSAEELERPTDNEPGLEIEIGIIKKLQFSKYVTRYKDEGRVGPLRYVIMQLVGKNLADLRTRCPQAHFSPNTTANLALQCLEAINDVHSVGFIHRDIKPSNFAIGRLPRDVRTVYILDFGLVRSYTTSTGEIRPPRDRVGFRGTVRYAALNAHLCKELSRADDLWSWLYMIAEMFIGELPWRNETDRDRVGRMKQTIPRHKLLCGMDKEYSWLYEHIRTLTYEKAPDYEFLTKTVQMALKKRNYSINEAMDWEPGGFSFNQSLAANVQPYAVQMHDKKNVVNVRLPGEQHTDVVED